MKYWKEKESNPVEDMEFWSGKTITKLADNEIFVMGTNPSGIHGAGAAKAGLKFGAKMLVGRGLVGSTYGLITKNLEGKEGFFEKETGLVYEKTGFRSVSPKQIRDNINEMYEVARQPEHQNKKFLVTYQYESWPNGSPKKSLNGYTSQEILEMFAKDQDVPPNIVFHDSYKPHLEKLYQNQNKQSTGELVIYENDKSIDIKEENIVWTIDSDERNPQARHFAGAARAALAFGAVPLNIKQNKPGIARGFSPNYKTFGIITKNLQAGITIDGITYDKEGYLSVSKEQIKSQIDEMYELAKQPEHKNKRFLITYKYESWPNGTPKKSLNGYTSQEMLEMFVRKDMPENIVFHDSYKPHLEKALSKLVENQPEETQNMQPEQKPKEYTFFFHLTSPFSNFHPSKFEYKELTFISNEQFMMYSKAKTFKDEATAQKIIEMNNTPLIKDFIDGKITREEIVNDKVKADQWNKLMMKIKGFGKDVSPYNDEVWSNRRAKVVLFGAREKFSQNEDLKQILMNTGDTYMVEASPYDKIWGIGLSAGDAKRIPEEKWPGLNLLGQVLDVLKAEFKAQLNNKVESLPRKKF